MTVRATNFRDEFIAAPLKPAGVIPPGPEVPHFRDEFIAAPLKLGILGRGSPRPFKSPFPAILHPQASMKQSYLRMIPVAALAASLLAAQAPGRGKRTVTDAEVARVHKSAILIDTHNDV